MKENDKLEKANFKFEVPLDTSGIEGFSPDQQVKVLVKALDGSQKSQTVKFNEKGDGIAIFTFDKKPGPLHVLIGPDDASEEELIGMQTMNLDISTRQWGDGPVLRIPPIRIPPYYWFWWRRWCRTFTIRGRVLCPNGRPVPGAKVCAYDTDSWWWWSSKQLVGCDTTDGFGAFEIKFRWCCGWWPWWWWRNRVWHLEPNFVKHILPLLQREPKLRKLPIPDPRPDLQIFENMLMQLENSVVPPELLSSSLIMEKIEANSDVSLSRQEFNIQQKTEIDMVVLDDLRVRLKEKLSVISELERLRIWPWWPWYPWWDCTPDIIFRVTQNCLGADRVIVDENISNTRWNIPTNLDVTLVARSACCVEPNNDPTGDCMVITHACSDQIQFIGGNPGAVATPAGYLNPGLISYAGDRPFAGNVPITGLFGDLTNVDYYEFEWSDNGVAWNPMPPSAAGGFTRTYWGPKLGGGPIDFHNVTFPFINIGGNNVIESRQHFESTNDPATWGLSRFWTNNRDLLMVWLTKNGFEDFADGTYRLRLKSWKLGPGDKLINQHILPLCDTEKDNGIVLTIDNRIVGLGSGHPPTTPSHPCGDNTVHDCTLEPDTDFLDVLINGKSVKACDIVDADGDLEIDFMAHDPDGHLSYYTLIATYGENQMINLLTLSSPDPLHPSPLYVGPLGGPVPPAIQVGPTYAHARLAGAVAPIWSGGTLTLRVKAKDAFPVTCAYQFELRAYKRTIDSCDHGLPHRNLSEFSLTVKV